MPYFIESFLVINKQILFFVLTFLQEHKVAEKCFPNVKPISEFKIYDIKIISL